MNKSTPYFLILCTIMFFIFFQLLTTMIEATYTFGLLGTEIPPEIVFVAFLLSPLLLLIYPRNLAGNQGRIFATITGMLSLLCWCVLLSLDTRGRMIVSGIGTGSMLLFFPALIKQKSSLPGVQMGGALAFAILVSVMLRQINYGTGFLPAGSNLGFPILVTLLGIVAFMRWFRAPIDPPSIESQSPRSFLQAALLFLGLASVLILLYFAFSNPAVIARWSGASYPWVIGPCVAATALFLIWLFAPDRRFHTLPRSLLLGWNVLFLATLIGTILPYQIHFPLDPATSVYPLAEPAAGPMATVILTIMLLLHPVLYLDAILLLDRLANGNVSSFHLAGGMALLSIYQLLFILAHIFTTVYDYIPVIGPFFRDRFWLVNALPGLILLLSVLFSKVSFTWFPQPSLKWWPAMIAGVSAVLTIIIMASISISPGSQTAGSELRVMTYNLQQGYSQDGQKNFAGQLAVIRDRQPDILGLQETDTARVAGGNSDLVRYLAGNLRMYAYYGPKTVTGTFGIALLSRYPIENPRTYFLYSIGEQTAVIEAQVHVAGQPFTVMVTHLGNGGPIIQQRQILQLTQGKPNLILMGDFNFRPSTEQYRLTAALFQDSWLSAVEKEINLPDQDLDHRIDHIFLSPGLNVSSYEYIGEGPSDHPAVSIALKPLP